MIPYNMITNYCKLMKKQRKKHSNKYILASTPILNLIQGITKSLTIIN